MKALVHVEKAYSKDVSRQRLAIERNASLLEVTVPIGIIRSPLALMPPLRSTRAARGSSVEMSHVARIEPPRTLGRTERALIAAIAFVSMASIVVALI